MRPESADSPAVNPTVAVPDADALTCEQVAELLGRPLRSVQRQIAVWEVRGWPIVRRAATDSRKWRLLVDRDSFERYLAGEFPEPLLADAA